MAKPAAPANTTPASADTSKVPLPPTGKTVSDEQAFNSGSRVDTSGPDQAAKPAPLLPGDSGMIAGGIVVLLGIGGATALLASRRRRAGETAYDVDAPVAPIEPRPAATAIAEPVAVGPARAEFAPVPAAQAMSSPRPLAAPPAMEGLVPHGEAREALIRRMVEAQPDAANPFTSGKARRRRARLILQAREQHQRKAEQPFDFRTYKSSVRAAGEEAPKTPADIMA